MNATEKRRELDGRTRSEVCAACGSELLIAFWQGELVLRCATCNVYGPDTRPRYTASLKTRYRKAGSVSAAGFTAIEIQGLTHQLEREIQESEGRGETPRPATVALLEKLEAEVNGNDSRAVTPYQERGVALVDPQEAVRFLDFSKLTNGGLLRSHAIALIAETGLQPALGELIVYEGKLYVTVQGLGRLAAPVLDGIDPPKFWSKPEKEAAGYAEDDIVASVTVYRKGASRGMTGTGRANVSRPMRGNKSSYEIQFPQRAAENRALRHVYRMGFRDMLGRHNVELVPDEVQEQLDAGTFVDSTAREIVGADAAGGVYVDAAAPSTPARVVDPETGEIMPAASAEPGPTFAPSDPAEESAEEGSPEPPQRITAAQLKAIRPLGERKWGAQALARHILLEYGAERLEDLTVGQANKVYDMLANDLPPVKE